MYDPQAFASQLALDLLREHAHELDGARTVADARERIAPRAAEARALCDQRGVAPDVFDAALDALLARLVVLERPRVDGRGAIYDAAASRSGWVWLLALTVVVVVVAAYVVVAG